MLRLAFTAPVDTDGDGLMDAKGGDGAGMRLWSDPTQDRRDRFGRMLAYVTTLSGRNLGVEQLAKGWAKVFVFDRPFARGDALPGGGAACTTRGRGAWGLCGGNFHGRV
jgi:endonuclease YncB( thermonuclease family)